MLKTLARWILSWWLPVGSTMNTWQELEAASSSSSTYRSHFNIFNRCYILESLPRWGWGRSGKK
jgi:hypothetical protein